MLCHCVNCLLNLFVSGFAFDTKDHYFPPFTIPKLKTLE